MLGGLFCGRIFFVNTLNVLAVGFMGSQARPSRNNDVMYSFVLKNCCNLRMVRVFGPLRNLCL